MMVLNLIVLIFFKTSALAASKAKKATNEQVAQSWQQNNPQAPRPEVVEKDDGSTEIKWKGQVTPDFYTNTVTSANASQNSSLNEGSFHKTTVTSDIKRIKSTGEVDYFLLSLLETDDPAVLSGRYYQLSNFQIGHLGSNYSVILGDIIPQFSSLGSSLSARGLMYQANWEKLFNLSAYYGVIAESWEALLKQVDRTQFLKDVYGLKLEKNLTDSFSAYLTGQSGVDNKSSFTNSYALESKLSSVTFGGNYEKEQVQISGELGSSKNTLGSFGEEQGEAYIIDGKWGAETVSVFAGVHKLDADYFSLSSAASPGITENYLGLDWAAKEWLNLGADTRDTKSFTVNVTDPQSTTKTNSFRLNTNLNSESWNLGFQRSVNDTTSVSSGDNKINQSNVSLGYNGLAWSTSFSVAQGDYDYGTGSTSNTKTDDVQVSIGNKASFGDETDEGEKEWVLDTVLSYTSQTQSVVGSSDLKNKLYGLSLTLSHGRYGVLTLVGSSGRMVSPVAGNMELITTSVQFEARHDFKNQSSLKLYYKDDARNLNDATLETKEKVVGVKYAYKF